MKELEYPFDSDFILKKKKSLKKQLLESNGTWIEKNIAILGGSTTNDIKIILELFLLNQGIKPYFYESEYNQYYEDAMFSNKSLEEFKPDIILIHTTNRNITQYPTVVDLKEDIDNLLEKEYKKFEMMWNRLSEVYHCPIIQNNFELPSYRLLGNKDASDIHGKVNFITKLNMKFYEYANSNENFFINDIHYISASYGLEKWLDPFYWHMYKYALAVPAIPTLCFNIANIIKAIFGKNKKGMVLDLDNTLWGGIIGDDGVDNIEIGPEVPSGQVYSEFQEYIKEHKQLGVILNINSKNEKENALAGLNHPDGVLKPDDFIMIKANWEPKSKNIIDIANELNLGVDSLVFIDDNPAEREIVRQQVKGVAIPEMNTPEHYIQMIDRSGFFETVHLSKDDFKKTEMYQENAKRNELLRTFSHYDDYLTSLKMKAIIRPFEQIYMARIAQLTNKSNQFNLTTRRYTQAEIEAIAHDTNYITLYGKLVDTFGDNGVVTVVIGHIDKDILNIDLWIMSCRVLKRDMEFAMMDSLVKTCQKQGIKMLRGYYYPTAKNSMVKDFYHLQGFEKESEDDKGNSIWKLDIQKSYKEKNKFIEIEDSFNNCDNLF